MGIAVKALPVQLLCCVDCKNLNFNMRAGFWRNKCVHRIALLVVSPIFAQKLDCDALIKQSPYPVSSTTTQVIITVPEARRSSQATVAACELGEDGHWRIPSKGYDSFAAIVGTAGVAAPGTKVEGDNKTPAGLFYIGEAFGYYPLALSAIPDLKMDYRYIIHKQLPNGQELDKFIDDSTSPENNYNSWMIGETTAKSYENMWRPDFLYEYGAIVNYNMDPAVPGKGSAIFLHIWGENKTSTAGCIALKKPDLLKLLSWLDKTKQPQILVKYK